MALIARGTGSAFFRGLSSFWTRVFKDSKVLDSMYSAGEVLFGGVYLELMEAVLSKSIRATPVFSKKDWKLLLLNDTDISFDPAVYSFATSKDLAVPITLTAKELSKKHDETSVILTDSLSLPAERKAFYPTYGLYNSAVLFDSPSYDKQWTAIVPTGATVRDSVSALTARLVSQKKITDFVVTKSPDVSQLSADVRVKFSLQGTWNGMTGKVNETGLALPVSAPVTTLDAGNVGNYYTVSVAGNFSIDGSSTWAVDDLIVSSGTGWVRAANTKPTFTLRYGTEDSDPIVLEPQTYGSLAALRTALESAVKLAFNVTVFKVPNLSDPANQAKLDALFLKNFAVEIDGGHVLIRSKTGKDLYVWTSNTACEKALFLKAFRFKFTADVPPGREKEILWVQTRPIQFITRGFANPGTDYRFPIDASIKGAKYIYNTLYEPSVVLEDRRHFRIQNGFIYFSQNKDQAQTAPGVYPKNPFEFEGLATRDLGNGRRQIALWMSDVSVDTLALYYNFGYRFTRIQPSSQAYKDFLRGIWFYYTHGPQVERIESALNLIAGIPVAQGDGEIVLSVLDGNTRVITDKNVYTFDPKTPATVTPGTVLQAFDKMTDAFLVEDYIRNPGWFDRISIPDYLIPEAPHGFKVSNKEALFPLVGDSGFIAGDLVKEGVTLTTNVLPGPFSLSTFAYFVLEKDSSRVSYPVYVPTDMTTGAASVTDVIAYLLKATKQIKGKTVACEGGNPFRPLTDVQFTLSFRGVDHVVSLLRTETGSVVSPVTLVSALQAKLNTALGAGNVSVYFFDDSLVLIPQVDTKIRLSGLNVSASAELGLYPASSLLGVKITENAGRLVWASATVGNTSKIKITDINNSAVSTLGMRSFRPGSGDFFGGDIEMASPGVPALGADGKHIRKTTPSPGWDVMNTYLKYNTFRVTFNPSLVTLPEGSMTVPEIVNSGRPLYTSAIIVPEFKLTDVVTSLDAQYTDVAMVPISALGAYLASIKIKREAKLALTHPPRRFYRKDGVSGDPERMNYLLDLTTFCTITAGSSGAISVRAKEEGLRFKDHVIEVTDVVSVKPADSGIFNRPGIYNRGKTEGGVTVAPVEIGGYTTGRVAGIYPIIYTKNGIHYNWVHGLDLGDVTGAATHVFVVDQTLKASLDLFTAGIAAGDSMEIKFPKDHLNGGRFAVLGFFRNQNYLGTLEKVDIIVYGNNVSAVTPDENWAENSAQSFMSVSFKSKSTGINKQWLVILPSSGTLADRVTAASSAGSDDRDIFPFALVGSGTWASPSPSYYSGTTGHAVPGEEVMPGELYKMSFDSDSEWAEHGSVLHTDEVGNDDEARAIWRSNLKTPKAFLIGEPFIKISAMSPGITALEETILKPQGLWNSRLNIPTLPTPSPSNLGFYYIVNVGNSPVASETFYAVGDYIVSDGVGWVHYPNSEPTRVIGEVVPYFAHEQKSVKATLGAFGWGKTGATKYDTVGIDTAAVGRLARTAEEITLPFYLGQFRLERDPLSSVDKLQDLYVRYDADHKIGSETYVHYGEVAFYRSVDVAFSNIKTPDHAEYYSVNLVDTVTRSIVQRHPTPTGGTDFPYEEYPLVQGATVSDLGAYELNPFFGLHPQVETSPFLQGSTDVNAGLIGAGLLPGDPDSLIGAGYVIGGNTLWAGVIGPWSEGLPIVGDVSLSCGYFATLELIQYPA